MMRSFNASGKRVHVNWSSMYACAATAKLRFFGQVATSGLRKGTRHSSVFELSGSYDVVREQAEHQIYDFRGSDWFGLTKCIYNRLTGKLRVFGGFSTSEECHNF